MLCNIICTIRSDRPKTFRVKSRSTYRIFLQVYSSPYHFFQYPVPRMGGVLLHFQGMLLRKRKKPMVIFFKYALGKKLDPGFISSIQTAPFDKWIWHEKVMIFGQTKICKEEYLLVRAFITYSTKIRSNTGGGGYKQMTPSSVLGNITHPYLLRLHSNHVTVWTIHLFLWYQNMRSNNICTSADMMTLINRLF